MSREKEQKILDQGIGLPRAPETTSRLLLVDSAPVSHEEWKADLQNKGYGKKKMPPQNHHNNDGCIYFSATLIMTFFFIPHFCHCLKDYVIYICFCFS
jgi:hypothetical protein